jgi:GNAT superfamily N-acetyltransferase
MTNPEHFPASEKTENDKSKNLAEMEENARMVRGKIAEKEISDYLKHPVGILFEHLLVDKKSEKETLIKIRYLTREFLPATLESLKSAWDEQTFKNFDATLNTRLDQKESGKPLSLDAEYYIATDKHDNPIGITGLYVSNIAGGANLTTKNKLNPEQHYLNMGLAWYSVSKEFQGRGVGKYLFDWTENMAKSRGANHFEIETDDAPNSAKALEIYKKAGYEVGHAIKDYYGPNRNLNVYYHNCAKDGKQKEAQLEQTKEITEDNEEEILKIARKTYSPERFEEFKLCLDLLLAQDKTSQDFSDNRLMAITDPSGKPESFAIFHIDSVYNNGIFIYWMGVGGEKTDAKKKLLSALKTESEKMGRDVIMIYNEGNDFELSQNGFEEAKNGIPYVYDKGDPSKFLLLSKKL